MEPKILQKIEKYGRYSETFPLKKGPVGPVEVKGVRGQQIKIYLTSDGIEIYDKNNVLEKSIFYDEIDACINLNVAEHLKIPKSTLTFSAYKVETILLHYSNNKKLYLLFWSTIAGWQPKRHAKVFNKIQEHINRPNIKDFLIALAPKYDDFKIPISRIQEEYPLDVNEIRHIVEEITDSNFKFKQSKDYILVKPKPKIEVERVSINGEEKFNVVDKIEIPLEFHITNRGTYPARISLHLDAANLPTGKPHPPFDIKPGETAIKTFHVSTFVKDNEYTMNLLLCDNNDDNVEIEDSGVTFTINRKTSKKMKLKNILKAALYQSANVLGIARKI